MSGDWRADFQAGPRRLRRSLGQLLTVLALVCSGEPMGKQDGWFGGLVFDAEGKARYSVATFVRRGGLGSGHTAEISVRLLASWQQSVNTIVFKPMPNARVTMMAAENQRWEAIIRKA
jgi:hypothetical protein